MSSERKICVFSLSRTDLAFTFSVGIERAISWLEGKKIPPHRYYFRSAKPKNGLPPGSIILFSFDGQIFGQAILKDDIKPLSPEELNKERKAPKSDKYKYYVTLDSKSIEIFRFHPTKEEITEQTELIFAQLYTYLDPAQYGQIMKMTRR
jgi:hypothetical protein